jgi:hypothetical protein
MPLVFGLTAAPAILQSWSPAIVVTILLVLTVCLFMAPVFILGYRSEVRFMRAIAQDLDDGIVGIYEGKVFIDRAARSVDGSRYTDHFLVLNSSDGELRFKISKGKARKLEKLPRAYISFALNSRLLLEVRDPGGKTEVALDRNGRIRDEGWRKSQRTP